MTPMAQLAAGNGDTYDVENSNNCETKVITHGLARAAKIAQNDLKSFDSDQDMIEQEESESIDSITPSGLEGGALQFSGLDLNIGMIEIRNGRRTFSVRWVCVVE
eukprot:513257_1